MAEPHGRPGTEGEPATPGGVGYVRVSTQAPGAGLVAAGIAAMEAFARGCGYRLGEVFLDEDELGRELGWWSLVDAVRVTRPVAVLVADIDGLRLPDRDVALLRARLRRVTNAPLVLARVPTPAAPAAGRPRPAEFGSPDRQGSVPRHRGSRRWAW